MLAAVWCWICSHKHHICWSLWKAVLYSKTFIKSTRTRYYLPALCQCVFHLSWYASANTRIHYKHISKTAFLPSQGSHQSHFIFFLSWSPSKLGLSSLLMWLGYGNKLPCWWRVDCTVCWIIFSLFVTKFLTAQTLSCLWKCMCINMHSYTLYCNYWHLYSIGFKVKVQHLCHTLVFTKDKNTCMLKLDLMTTVWYNFYSPGYQFMYSHARKCCHKIQLFSCTKQYPLFLIFMYNTKQSLLSLHSHEMKFIAQNRVHVQI